MNENVCTCYVSHNLNTNKDEQTLSRDCPVHLEEATAFYAEQDRKTSEAAALRESLRKRPSPIGQYRFAVSEGGDSERISAQHILREIHDSMCMCGVWDDCDTEGINGTLIDAAQGLLTEGKFHHDFEDGWISVEAI